MAYRETEKMRQRKAEARKKIMFALQRAGIKEWLSSTPRIVLMNIV